MVHNNQPAGVKKAEGLGDSEGVEMHERPSKDIEWLGYTHVGVLVIAILATISTPTW